MELKVIEKRDLYFCGCVCDDIELHADDVRIHQAKKAMCWEKSWFLNHTAEKISRRSNRWTAGFLGSSD